VIALLGAFTVSITSFVMPPFLHLCLLTHPTQRLVHFDMTKKLPTFVVIEDDDRVDYYKDILYIFFGLSLTIIATVVSLTTFIQQIKHGVNCSAR
jgi:hypothetical protein